MPAKGIIPIIRNIKEGLENKQELKPKQRRRLNSSGVPKIFLFLARELQKEKNQAHCSEKSHFFAYDAKIESVIGWQKPEFLLA